MKNSLNENKRLSEYLENYLGPFERQQVIQRQKKVLDILKKYKPKRILEVGCGKDSLINHIDISKIDNFVIVEPIKDFLDNAVKIESDKLKEYNCRIEDAFGIKNYDFDFILMSGLLHEVFQPSEILKSIRQIASNTAIIHINVPNALSLHRLIALEMGIISSFYDRSETQKILNQPNTYDLALLRELVESNKFEVIEEGSYFIKPFTHLQMQKLLDFEIIDVKVLEGLDKIIKYLPQYGSEVYMNLKIL